MAFKWCLGELLPVLCLFLTIMKSLESLCVASGLDDLGVVPVVFPLCSPMIGLSLHEGVVMAVELADGRRPHVSEGLVACVQGRGNRGES